MNDFSFTVAGVTVAGIIVMALIVILAILCPVILAMYLKLLKKYREAINDSITDPLTGLYNRRFLERLIAEETSRAARFERSFITMLIDLDNFKMVNDACGHKTGDEVLKKVADSIKQLLRRAYDIAARYGGDEFVLILPETSLEAAAEMAAKIGRSIKNIKIKNTAIEISASIGIHELNVKNMQDDPIQQADIKMYWVKKVTKNVSKILA